MTIRVKLSDCARLGLTPDQKKPPKPLCKKSETMQRRLFMEACEAHGLPRPISELQFDIKRKWRWDFAWIFPKTPCCGMRPKLALEIDGGAWTQGRHTRGKGFIEDQAKQNAGVLLGWRILRCTPEDVKSGKVFELLKIAMVVIS